MPMMAVLAVRQEQMAMRRPCSKTSRSRNSSWMETRTNQQTIQKTNGSSSSQQTMTSRFRRWMSRQDPGDGQQQQQLVEEEDQQQDEPDQVTVWAGKLLGVMQARPPPDRKPLTLDQVQQWMEDHQVPSGLEALATPRSSGRRITGNHSWGNEEACAFCCACC